MGIGMLCWNRGAKLEFADALQSRSVVTTCSGLRENISSRGASEVTKAAGSDCTAFIVCNRTGRVTLSIAFGLFTGFITLMVNLCKSLCLV